MQQRHGGIARLLVLLLVAQSLLLPVFSQAVPLQNSSGKWVMVCTLQGMQRTRQEQPQAPGQHSKYQHCPACSLAHNINASLPPDLPYLFITEAKDSYLAIADRQLIDTPRIHYSRIRAPPLSR